jgi:hypothetical protein
VRERRMHRRVENVCCCHRRSFPSPWVFRCFSVNKRSGQKGGEGRNGFFYESATGTNRARFNDEAEEVARADECENGMEWRRRKGMYAAVGRQARGRERDSTHMHTTGAIRPTSCLSCLCKPLTLHPQLSVCPSTLKQRVHFPQEDRTRVKGGDSKDEVRYNPPHLKDRPRCERFYAFSANLLGF